ncbi:MAG: tetratricopeptide repeat protein [Deltaproteobacteria bacterium]|nr:tetratricopeptide repeat protein [Deltaproteobacteria bacterium]
MMYWESDLYNEAALGAAYQLIEGAVSFARTRIGGKKLERSAEAVMYYDVIKERGAFIDNQDSLVMGLNDRSFDCDTSAFLAMAIGDERGMKLSPVRAPRHLFLRVKNKTGEEVNIDQGQVTENSYYKVRPELVHKGIYLRTSDDQQTDNVFLANRGNLFAKRRKYAEALKNYTLVVMRDPNDIFTLMNQAEALAGLGRFQEAEEILKRGLVLDPQDAGVLFTKASLYYRFQKYDKALDAYQNMLVLFPQDADAHNGLGLTLCKLGKHKEAAQSFIAAGKLSPQNANYHHNLAQVFHDFKKYDQALNFFNLAIQYDSQNADHYSDRALTFYELGRYQEALADIDHALQLQPDHPNATGNRIILLRAMASKKENK